MYTTLGTVLVVLWHQSQILLRHCKHAFVPIISLHFANFRHCRHCMYARGKQHRSTKQHTASSLLSHDALCGLWAEGCRQSVQSSVYNLVTCCLLPSSCTHQLWIKNIFILILKRGIEAIILYPICSIIKSSAKLYLLMHPQPGIKIHHLLHGKIDSWVPPWQATSIPGGFVAVILQAAADWSGFVHPDYDE